MPQYFQTQNPWLGAAQAGRGLGDVIQDSLLQVPKARAEGRMMQQEFLMNQLKMQQEQQLAPFQTDLLRAQTAEKQSGATANLAQAGSYDAQAALTRAKTGQITQQDQLHMQTGVAAGNFFKEAVTTGKVSPDTVQGLAQALFSLDKLDPNAMKSMVQAIETSASGVATNQPLAASAVTGAKVPLRMNVPAGSTSVETMNPQEGAFTVPGKPVSEDANDVKLITGLLSQGVDPTNVVAMARDIKNRMNFGQMQNAPSASPVAGQGGAPTNAPTPGQIEDGFRFKGGNPADPNSWEKVQ